MFIQFKVCRNEWNDGTCQLPFIACLISLSEMVTSPDCQVSALLPILENQILSAIISSFRGNCMDLSRLVQCSHSVDEI